jgi:hypothetical protein
MFMGWAESLVDFIWNYQLVLIRSGLSNEYTLLWHWLLSAAYVAPWTHTLGTHMQPELEVVLPNQFPH